MIANVVEHVLFGVDVSVGDQHDAPPCRGMASAFLIAASSSVPPPPCLGPTKPSAFSRFTRVAGIDSRENVCDPSAKTTMLKVSVERRTPARSRRSVLAVFSGN